jgi:hypothetical protein
MGSTCKSDRIDEALWSHHRPAIERLYIKEDRKLEKHNGVIECMARNYGFVARYVCFRSTIHFGTGSHDWQQIAIRTSLQKVAIAEEFDKTRMVPDNPVHERTAN